MDIAKLQGDDADFARSVEAVQFHDVFPSAVKLPARLDGLEFLAFDQYCVRKACDCSSVMLSFVQVVGGRALPEQQWALFDYRNGKAKAIPPLLAGVPGPERIIDAMKAGNRQVAKFLSLRHSAIRVVYRRFLEKHETRMTPEAGLRVGRNEPCPCGSGKKYKRCHGA
jgi:hypothetical protein